MRNFLITKALSVLLKAFSVLIITCLALHFGNEIIHNNIIIPRDLTILLMIMIAYLSPWIFLLKSLRKEGVIA
jgi:hypothetical protein